jgi:hypothetical protein
MLSESDQDQNIRSQIAVLGFGPQKLMDYIKQLAFSNRRRYAQSVSAVGIGRTHNIAQHIQLAEFVVFEVAQQGVAGFIDSGVGRAREH